MNRPTGPDYLLTVAGEATKNGVPFAEDFRDMVIACFSRPAVLPTIAVAQRPLRPEEQVAVAVVGSAVADAFNSRDMTSVEEALRVGLSLAVKFREYLELRVNPDGTPRLPVE